MRWLFIAEWAVRLPMFVLIVLRKRSPTMALAWLAIVAFLPFLGALAYLMFGEVRLGRRRSVAYQQLVDSFSTSEPLRAQFERTGHARIGGVHRRIADMAGAVGATEPRPGNRVELIDDAIRLFRRLARDIDGAEHHCHILFYIADEDDVARDIVDSLIRARRRGVACRVLLDAAGSRRFLRGPLAGALRRGGVDVVPMLPVGGIRAAARRIDLRNHRKLCVIDGRVGYLGSHNLTDAIYPGKEAFGDWMDASVRLEGPIVYDLQDVFLHDWAFDAPALPPDDAFFPTLDVDPDGATLSVLATAPTAEHAPLLDVFLQVLQLARFRCVLTTPYFVPDDALLSALRAAALRGVEVVLVVPERGDHALTRAAGRSHYGFLLDHGVQIREYPGALLHAKTLTMDREFAIIGSANVDVRSFLLNFELALLVYDTDLASQIHYLQAEYLEKARALEKDVWARRGAVRVLRDNVAKLVTPLL